MPFILHSLLVDGSINEVGFLELVTYHEGGVYAQRTHQQ